MELIPIETIEHRHGPTAIRVAGVAGLDPRDVTGEQVHIGDCIWTVLGVYPTSPWGVTGEPFAALVERPVIDR